jgi:putative ABC transport system ATP-binding protein
MALFELTEVRKIYQTGEGGEVRALDGINLEIGECEYLSIIGPSGSGKSTLMHLLGCLDRPTSGKIVLEGVDITRAGASKLSQLRNQKVGFVFQSYNLLPKLNVYENAELPLIYAGIGQGERKKRVGRALEAVGLAQRSKHRPGQLSGGQAQRVAIARALVNRPKIILADEPTGALDSKTGETILQLFHDLSLAGHTIALVTHDLKVAAATRRRISILDGKIQKDEWQVGFGSAALGTPKFGSTF